MLHGSCSIINLIIMQKLVTRETWSLMVFIDHYFSDLFVVSLMLKNGYKMIKPMVPCNFTHSSNWQTSSRLVLEQRHQLLSILYLYLTWSNNLPFLQRKKSKYSFIKYSLFNIWINAIYLGTFPLSIWHQMFFDFNFFHQLFRLNLNDTKCMFTLWFDF